MRWYCSNGGTVALVRLDKPSEQGEQGTTSSGRDNIMHVSVATSVVVFLLLTQNLVTHSNALERAARSSKRSTPAAFQR